jgi:uncharacterized protein YacL
MFLSRVFVCPWSFPMMNVNSLRTLFVLICCTAGYFTANPLHPFQGIIIGFTLSMLAFALEFIIRKVAIRDLLASLVGLFFGLFVSALIFAPLAYFMEAGPGKGLIVTGLFLVVPYLGIILAIKKKDELFLWRSRMNPPGSDAATPKILDTSVIVDGRIADIAQTRFLDGPLLLPRFVLAELQQIADSDEPMKRTRGRRGLEILEAMQKADVPLRVTDEDYPAHEGVDDKLVAMAKELKARLLTTDFNLNKVAELQGVEVLNVNDLANAVKAVVVPGEEMDLKVLREGKEKDQGLAYLDDGTMVVVENGNTFINQKIHVTITSVLQTAAGRMIFAKRKAG